MEPLGIPYLFITLRQGLVLASLSTGMVLRVFQEPFIQFSQSIKVKSFTPQKLVRLNDQSLITCYSDSSQSVLA